MVITADIDLNLRSTDDKYVFQFQKREKNPFNVFKPAPSKKVTVITFSPFIWMTFF